jgi:hypothetical protein
MQRKRTLTVQLDSLAERCELKEDEVEGDETTSARHT